MSGWIDDESPFKAVEGDSCGDPECTAPVEDEVSYGEIADDARDAVMATMLEGDRIGKNGWDMCSPEYHAYRALNHIGLFLIGDFGEPHLAHAQTRLAMAQYLTHRRQSPLRNDEFTSGELDK